LKYEGVTPEIAEGSSAVVWALALPCTCADGGSGTCGMVHKEARKLREASELQIKTVFRAFEFMREAETAVIKGGQAMMELKHEISRLVRSGGFHRSALVAGPHGSLSSPGRSKQFMISPHGEDGKVVVEDAKLRLTFRSEALCDLLAVQLKTKMKMKDGEMDVSNIKEHNTGLHEPQGAVTVHPSEETTVQLPTPLDPKLKVLKWHLGKQYERYATDLATALQQVRRCIVPSSQELDDLTPHSLTLSEKMSVSSHLWPFVFSLGARLDILGAAVTATGAMMPALESVRKQLLFDQSGDPPEEMVNTKAVKMIEAHFELQGAAGAAGASHFVDSLRSVGQLRDLAIEEAWVAMVKDDANERGLPDIPIEMIMKMKIPAGRLVACYASHQWRRTLQRQLEQIENRAKITAMKMISEEKAKAEGRTMIDGMQIATSGEIIPRRKVAGAVVDLDKSLEAKQKVIAAKLTLRAKGAAEREAEAALQAAQDQVGAIANRYELQRNEELHYQLLSGWLELMPKLMPVGAAQVPETEGATVTFTMWREFYAVVSDLTPEDTCFLGMLHHAWNATRWQEKLLDSLRATHHLPQENRQLGKTIYRKAVALMRVHKACEEQQQMMRNVTEPLRSLQCLPLGQLHPGPDIAKGAAAHGLDGLPRAMAQLDEEGELKELWLPGNRLRGVPLVVMELSQLQSLHLEYNSIPTLPDDLGKLSELTILSLSQNQLTEMPDGLGQLGTLRELHLEGNQFVYMPAVLLDGQQPLASSLRILSLQNNRLKGLRPASEGGGQSLCALCKLEVLQLQNNQLSSLPQKCFGERAGGALPLRVLLLHNNGLDAVPTSVENLAGLTKLTLHANQLKLTQLADDWPDMRRMKALQMVSLHTNNISGLPDALTNPNANGLELFRKLPVLALNGNLLTELPDSLDELDMCTELDVERNRLRRVPSSFVEMTAIVRANLSSNLITELPEEIAMLHRTLKELHLQDNQLKQLPASICQLSGLEVLDVARNAIVHLPKKFHMLHQLDDLTLLDNPLEEGLQRVVEGFKHIEGGGSSGTYLAPMERMYHTAMSKLVRYYEAQAKQFAALMVGKSELLPFNIPNRTYYDSRNPGQVRALTAAKPRPRKGHTGAAALYLDQQVLPLLDMDEDGSVIEEEFRRFFGKLCVWSGREVDTVLRYAFIEGEDEHGRPGVDKLGFLNMYALTNAIERIGLVEEPKTLKPSVQRMKCKAHNADKKGATSSSQSYSVVRHTRASTLASTKVAGGETLAKAVCKFMLIREQVAAEVMARREAGLGVESLEYDDTDMVVQVQGLQRVQERNFKDLANLQEVVVAFSKQQGKPDPTEGRDEVKELLEDADRRLGRGKFAKKGSAVFPTGSRHGTDHTTSVEHEILSREHTQLLEIQKDQLKLMATMQADLRALNPLVEAEFARGRKVPNKVMKASEFAQESEAAPVGVVRAVGKASRSTNGVGGKSGGDTKPKAAERKPEKKSKKKSRREGPPPIEVWVDDVGSARRFMITSARERTVLELKGAIKKQEELTVSPEQLILLFSHHHKRHDKLQDHVLLDAYGVGNGSLLKLVVGTSSTERYQANYGGK
jgi:Leucine-rich repeat (LRR) protein